MGIIQMKKFLIIFLILFSHSQVSAEDKQKLKVTTSISDQLKNLKDLYKTGVLSGYEYEQEKKSILNK
tara:strand:+ start:548 stop:751 length:204 start_codon:yes stop_codon:yes gene_type:complete